jgi:hypothetical protein
MIKIKRLTKTQQRVIAIKRFAKGSLMLAKVGLFPFSLVLKILNVVVSVLAIFSQRQIAALMLLLFAAVIMLQYLLSTQTIWDLL